MRNARLAFTLLVALGLSGCAGMTQTEQRVGVGALGGGAIGGVLGSFGGNAALGAVLGAGVGGVGGYLYDQSNRPDYRSNNRRSGYRR